ncbi:hypothetical protein GF352_02480 [archaeon]|nr:hypothetical protein [archaeon]
MKSDYFVEFVYHDEALRQQKNYKFLLEKYRQNKEGIEQLKETKMNEIDSFLNILEQLETDLKEFKTLIPKPPAKKKTTKKKTKKKKTKSKKTKSKKSKPKKKKAKKPEPELSDLKMGLEKIRDELSRM